MSEDYSLTDSALNAVAEDLGKQTMDLDLRIEIVNLEDLGWHAKIMSAGNQVAAAGGPVEDFALVMARLFARATVSIEEYREKIAEDADLD